MMTSLEIAELTGKMHKDVMKAIRNMEPAWEKVQGDWQDAQGRDESHPKHGASMGESTRAQICSLAKNSENSECSF